MYSDIQPPADYYKRDPSAGWYDAGGNTWHDVARKRGAEDSEYRLLERMSYTGEPVFSLRAVFTQLGSWAAAAGLHLRRVIMGQSESAQQSVYRIKIKETLNRSIGYLMGEIAVLPQENGETVLVGSFMDQAALRGLLDQLWNLNFTVLSIEQIKDAGFQGAAT